MILQHSGGGYKVLCVILEKTKMKFMHRGDNIVFDNAPQIDLILQRSLLRRRVRPL